MTDNINIFHVCNDAEGSMCEGAKRSLEEARAEAQEHADKHGKPYHVMQAVETVYPRTNS